MWNIPRIQVDFSVNDIDTPRHLPPQIPNNLKARLIAVKYLKNQVKGNKQGDTDEQPGVFGFKDLDHPNQP